MFVEINNHTIGQDKCTLVLNTKHAKLAQAWNWTWRRLILPRLRLKKIKNRIFWLIDFDWFSRKTIPRYSKYLNYYSAFPKPSWWRKSSGDVTVCWWWTAAWTGLNVSLRLLIRGVCCWLPLYFNVWSVFCRRTQHPSSAWWKFVMRSVASGPFLAPWCILGAGATWHGPLFFIMDTTRSHHVSWALVFVLGCALFILGGGVFSLALKKKRIAVLRVALH